MYCTSLPPENIKHSYTGDMVSTSPAEINSRNALLSRSWPRRKKGVLKFENNETRKQIIFYQET